MSARVFIASALLIAFSFTGGLGIVLNGTVAILVGWLGFAVTLLVASRIAWARPNGRARSRSRERG
jgi:hypothetical protein